MTGTTAPAETMKTNDNDNYAKATDVDVMGAALVLRCVIATFFPFPFSLTLPSKQYELGVAQVLLYYNLFLLAYKRIPSVQLISPGALVAP
jgi:hypothetical protein